MVASEHKSTAYHGPGIRQVIMGVYEAIRDKGVHDPVCQIAGYLLSGEPAYITGFRGARELIQSGCTVSGFFDSNRPVRLTLS
jgi:uncharacterized protein (UPF0297 family)